MSEETRATLREWVEENLVVNVVWQPSGLLCPRCGFTLYENVLENRKGEVEVLQTICLNCGYK